MNDGAAIAGAATAAVGARQPSRRRLAWLLGLLAAAFALRAAVIILFPSFYYADENYQFLEPAHRLAFGYGLETWEFREGMRSLLGPALMSKVFALVVSLGGGPEAYILVGRLLLAALSLLAVVAAYFAGLRRSLAHALIAGAVAASWFELVYFAGRPLTEAMATTFLLTALCLVDGRTEPLSRRRLAALGFCLGCCLMLRMHLAPGLAIISLWAARTRFRSAWLPLLLGAALPVAAFGVSDWISWGSPFHSYLAAFRINLIADKASRFGVRPIWWYAWNVVYLWGGALPVMLALLALRWRVYALWLLVAAAIIVSHNLIPHKEYRFIFPALACLVLAAALASADLVNWAARSMSVRRAGALTAGAIAVWVATSACLAVAPGYFRGNWVNGRDAISAFFWMSRRPDMCGLLLHNYPWWGTGGYAYLHRNVPLYMRTRLYPATPPPTLYNYVMLERQALPAFPAFVPQRCDGADPADLCVAARSGACTRDEAAWPPLASWPGLGEK